MRIVISLMMMVLLVIATNSCDDRDDNLVTANIRIKNTSNVNFSSVGVINDSIVYENVSSDSFSEYKEYITAFEAMPFSVTTDSAVFNYVPPELPSDPLPIGLYTYEISITDEGVVLLQFSID